MSVKIQDVKVINDGNWDDLVVETYKRPYQFQQQYGCQDRGVSHLTIPCDYDEEDEMYEDIPRIVNGDLKGVKFETWLKQDPNESFFGDKIDYKTDLFWERNFYPSIYTVANDLYKKGLIEAGDYIINIDW